MGLGVDLVAAAFRKPVRGRSWTCWRKRLQSARNSTMMNREGLAWRHWHSLARLSRIHLHRHGADKGQRGGRECFTCLGERRLTCRGPRREETISLGARGSCSGPWSRQQVQWRGNCCHARASTRIPAGDGPSIRPCRIPSSLSLTTTTAATCTAKGWAREFRAPSMRLSALQPTMATHQTPRRPLSEQSGGI